MPRLSDIDDCTNTSCAKCHPSTRRWHHSAYARLQLTDMLRIQYWQGCGNPNQWRPCSNGTRCGWPRIRMVHWTAKRNCWITCRDRTHGTGRYGPAQFRWERSLRWIMGMTNSEKQRSYESCIAAHVRRMSTRGVFQAHIGCAILQGIARLLASQLHVPDDG